MAHGKCTQRCQIRHRQTRDLCTPTEIMQIMGPLRMLEQSIFTMVVRSVIIVFLIIRVFTILETLMKYNHEVYWELLISQTVVKSNPIAAISLTSVVISTGRVVVLLTLRDEQLLQVVEI